MDVMILMIGEIVMYALIAVTLLIATITGIVCVWWPHAWDDVMVEPWAKAERRAAKKQAQEELRARREFWKT